MFLRMAKNVLLAAAKQAARAIHDAQALLITAGAGMGVDSGLPDFRGTEGLWREYPPLKELRLNFADMANPDWFARDPSFAWGFYGHRLNLYRRTVPHDGFGVLQRWASGMQGDHFVFTSNVDGQFQRAGFADNCVVECHGSIHFLQGLDGGPIISADEVSLPEVDPATLRVSEDVLPRLPDGSPARPNILMFGDWGWDGSRTETSHRALSSWMADLRRTRRSLVVVELGAGEAVPTVRRMSEAVARNFDCCLVRINPRDSHIPGGDRTAGVSLACGAAEGLSLIDSELAALRSAEE